MSTTKASPAAGNWVYPDREAWERLLHLQPAARSSRTQSMWWNRSARPVVASEGECTGIEALRRQLAWARKCFYYAESVLPDSQARLKAHRLAEQLGRARRAFDNAPGTDALNRVVEELADIGRYDPARYPRTFVDIAGASVAAAGRILAADARAAIAYWGRVLARAGAFFRAMKHDLPGG